MKSRRGGKAGEGAARRKRKINPMVFAAVGIVAVFGVIVTVVVQQLMKPVPPPREEGRQVMVFKPPPPPPPPEEPPPPPPEVEEEIEEPEEPEPSEEPADDTPPAGDLLGLDSEGLGAGDGYGLVGKKGGRSLLEGGGGNGYLFGEVEKAIQERLESITELRAVTYEVPASISFGADGCVKRVSLRQSTGDQEHDDLLSASVTGVCVKGRTTVEKLASKTVNLRIASR